MTYVVSGGALKP